jgi:quinol monooxygenase YgiN
VAPLARIAAPIGLEPRVPPLIEDLMILEIAKIRVKPGSAPDFEKAIAGAAAIFRRSPGCRRMGILRALESPNSYRLVIDWATLEEQRVHFQASPEFIEWRAIITPFLDGATEVENVESIGVGFGGLGEGQE